MKTLVALVGTKYRGPEAVKLLASLPQGEALTLKRDPANQYDRNCVEVWARGVLIGFVPKTQNRDLAMAMDAVMRERPDATGFTAKLAQRVPEALPDQKAIAVAIRGKLAIDGGKQPLVEIDE
jgi:hypothetical protein